MYTQPLCYKQDTALFHFILADLNRFEEFSFS